MEISRRTFSRGLGGMFGGAFVPGRKAVTSVLPAEPGFDDAYEKLLSEYICVEEAAIAAGRTTAMSHTGAATWEGRQLEGFIAELDGRVDIKTTARQIYSEFKMRFREAARRAQEKLQHEARVKERMLAPNCPSSEHDRPAPNQPSPHIDARPVDDEFGNDVDIPRISGHATDTGLGNEKAYLA